MTGPSHYQTLGVSPGISPEELKQTYRRLALQFHPDQNSDPEANLRFVAINEAYQVLSDPLKRRQYDRKLEQIRQGFQPPEPSSRVWQQPASAAHAPRQAEPEQDFSEAYFRAKQKQSQRHQQEFGAYTHMVKAISLLWLVFGLFLALDWSLQTEHGPLSIETIGVKAGRISSHTQVLVGKELIRLQDEWHYLLAPGDQMRWHRSRWLGVVTEVAISPRGNEQRLAELWNIRNRLPDLPPFGRGFVPQANVYSFFAPCWILMSLVAAVGLFWPSLGPERRFRLGLLATFLGLLSIVFVFLS